MQLTSELGAGTVFFLIGLALLWFGMPNKKGESPRFLQFEPALVLYPPIVLVFMTFGVAAIIYALTVSRP